MYRLFHTAVKLFSETREEKIEGVREKDADDSNET